MEHVFRFIRECGIRYPEKDIRFEKTQKGNWAVYYKGTHQGVFVPKDLLSEEQVKKHNKNASKK